MIGLSKRFTSLLSSLRRKWVYPVCCTSQTSLKLSWTSSAKVDYIHKELTVLIYTLCTGHHTLFSPFLERLVTIKHTFITAAVKNRGLEKIIEVAVQQIIEWIQFRRRNLIVFCTISCSLRSDQETQLIIIKWISMKQIENRKVTLNSR